MLRVLLDRRSGLMLAALFVMLRAEPAFAQEEETIRRPITEDVVIDGVPCARTGRAPAEFYATGRLLECPLSRDAVIATQSLPAGTWVIFHADGTINGAWLSRDTSLSGRVCRGEGYKKWSVRFYANGALKLCFLPEPTVIDGVPCRDGTFWGEIRGGGNTAAHFHPNGRLARCQAARPFTQSGSKYEKWDIVVHDSTGRVVSAMPSRGQ